MKRKVKAWLSFDSSDDGIRYGYRFGDRNFNYAIYVYRPKASKFDKYIPCTITYEVPTKERKRKKA